MSFTLSEGFLAHNDPQKLMDVYKKLPRGNLAYYNANSVDLFQEACRKAMFFSEKNKIPLNELLNAVFNLSNDLDELKSMLNTNKAPELPAKLETYRAKLDAFFYEYEKKGDYYSKEVVRLTHVLLTDSFQLFDEKNTDYEYLLSAQDRKSDIYSLGRLLNKQTALLCEMMDKIVRVREFGNTAVFDQFSLSSVPKAFADAARDIRRQDSLAYKQYVNTRAPVKPNPLVKGITSIDLKTFSDTTVGKAANLIGSVTGNKIKRKHLWSNLSQRSIHSYIEDLESLRDRDGFDHFHNRLRYSLGVLLSPILLLPFSIELLGFTCVSGITAAAFSLDVIRLCVQFVMLIVAWPLSYFYPNIAEALITFGGLFNKSLVSYVQDALRAYQINELNADEEQVSFLQEASKKPDDLVFLSDFVKSKTPAAQKVPNPNILTNPKPLEKLMIGRSPVAAVNEIMLGLSDDLIGSFRQNYPLISTSGYTIALTTLGLHLLPPSIIEQMHAKVLQTALQSAADWFAKNFMGHGHLVADPVNELFAVLLQWQASCMVPEIAGNLLDPQRNMLNSTVDNFAVLCAGLSLGMVSGYAFGMLPLINSIWAAPLNILIEEAKIAHAGTIPLTSIEYTCIMVKLGLLFYTLGEYGKHQESISGSKFEPKQLITPKEIVLALKDPLYNRYISTLSWSDREKFYNNILCVTLSENAYINLKDAFFNRYVRVDYPAICRLPFTLCYPLALFRAAYRTARLYLEPNNHTLETSIRMERAVDRVLFYDWVGLILRLGYQFIQMSLQTAVMFMVIPLVTAYAVGGFLPWLFGGFKGYDPIMFGQLIEFTLTFWHPATYSYCVIAQAAHTGCNYSDVQAIAETLDYNPDINNMPLQASI